MALCDKSIFAMISKCTIYYFFKAFKLELHDHMTFLEGIKLFQSLPSDTLAGIILEEWLGSHMFLHSSQTALTFGDLFLEFASLNMFGSIKSTKAEVA